jgi:hypothetical protein
MVGKSPTRSLEHLQNSASTARVLNLREVALRMRENPEFTAKPFFKNPDLNRSIIVKHRLRTNEFDQFSDMRSTATKILLPIDIKDLKMGAQFLFVDQKGFEQMIEEFFGIQANDDSADYRTLRLLDETPSLDPFLLREQMRRHGLHPAQCYFDLSPSDTRSILSFAQREIEPLVRITLGPDMALTAHARKLAQKILINSGDQDLEPLRRTMQMDHEQYREGMFCWKAFLYYKWRLVELLQNVPEVAQQIDSIRPRGFVDNDTKELLSSSRESIRSSFNLSLRRVRDTLRVYDSAYQGLTQKHDPVGFRNFLLNAPAMFHELGERLGAVDHVISFWRFRFPPKKPVAISGEDLADIFVDFERSLCFSDFAGANAA